MDNILTYFYIFIRINTVFSQIKSKSCCILKSESFISFNTPDSNSSETAILYINEIPQSRFNRPIIVCIFSTSIQRSKSGISIPRAKSNSSSIFLVPEPLSRTIKRSFFQIIHSLLDSFFKNVWETLQTPM